MYTSNLKINVIRGCQYLIGIITLWFKLIMHVSFNYACGCGVVEVFYICVGVVQCHIKSWWRHQLETFSALLAICAENSAVTGEFPTHRPVTRSFDVFFDLRLNKRLGKQSWGWWLETLSRPLWRHCNVYVIHERFKSHLHAYLISCWGCSCHIYTKWSIGQLQPRLLTYSTCKLEWFC